MATIFSNGYFNPSSSTGILQGDQQYGAQYQSNGYNTANWTQNIICNWAYRGSVTPSVGSYNSGYTLYSTNQQEMEAGLCKVTLNWIYQPSVLPPTAYSMQGAIEEMSYPTHPLFDTAQSLGGSMRTMANEYNFSGSSFNSGSWWQGQTAYYAPVTTVNVKTYYASQPSLDVADTPLGHLSTPGGSFGGMAVNYLVESYNVSLQGSFWIIDATYKYNGNGWDVGTYTTF